MKLEWLVYANYDTKQLSLVVRSIYETYRLDNETLVEPHPINKAYLQAYSVDLSLYPAVYFGRRLNC